LDWKAECTPRWRRKKIARIANIAGKSKLKNLTAMNADYTDYKEEFVYKTALGLPAFSVTKTPKRW
jgi:hypothetical protein